MAVEAAMVPNTTVNILSLVFNVAHLPLSSLLQQYSKNSYAAAIIPAYWITIGIGAGLLLALTIKLPGPSK
jgi:hypothetical protein